MYKFLLSTILMMLLIPLSGNAQTKTKYWIKFRDKGDLSIYQPTDILSRRALANRARQGIPLDYTDYPVKQEYIHKLKSLGVKPLRVSRWFNMVSAELTYFEAFDLQYLAFVEDVNPVLGVMRIADHLDEDCPNETLTDTPERQLEMVELSSLHRAGYTGKGITIAVFDNGYRGVDTLAAFRHLYAENRILAAYDFVDNDEDVYEPCVHCRHGSNVFSILAANQPGVLTGSAPEANYILLRTENDYSETHQEEDNWVAAAEFADSIGAQVFTTSLGYSSFDAGEGDYSAADLDGNTSIITRGADLAGEKGILVVNSAGNYGNRGISAPADGDYVIAVGAVDQCEEYAPFSSQGPRVDGVIKPDVTAMGSQTYVLLPNGDLARGSGTSFSCPVISGMLACVLQASPNATRQEVYDALIQSADRYEQPDKFHGYGVPNAQTMLELLGVSTVETQTYVDPFAAGELLIFPNPNTGVFMISLPSDVEAFDAKMEVYDLSGRILLREEISLSGLDSPLPISLDL
ncbi:MAG: S8 family serine peptidase, partial [Bacteroidota bacterium]